MLGEKVVGHPPADLVRLDPVLDAVAVGEHPVAAAVQIVRLEDLDLERQREPVREVARAVADEHLARLDNGIHGEALQPVEVLPSVRVDHHRVAMCLDRLEEAGALRLAGALHLRNDPITHHVVGNDRLDAGGERRVAHHVAGDEGKAGSGRIRGRVGIGAKRPP